MRIDGVSQTTGADRVVSVTAAGGGLMIAIGDRGGDGQRGVAVVTAEALADVLAEKPEGRLVLAGISGGRLGVELRRNEVWLEVGSADAAVGLDDLMDAVAAAE